MPWKFVVIVCAIAGSLIYAKVCKNVGVWNEIREYENNLRGCNVVVGYLKILLIENATMADYRNISFPELTEIRGFLLIYRVYGLTTLGKLFPNLTVIRGLNLFIDYAFVIYDMINLEEIGLYNLRQIGRGGTRIEKCPRLCYVDTVAWNLIGSSSHYLGYFNSNDDDCGNCPLRCNELCWNKEHCQEIGSDHCHSECIGCKGPGADQCYVCKHLNENGTCVSHCTEPNLANSAFGTCLAARDCTELPHGPWWPFKGECLNTCPLGYTKTSKEQGWCKYCGALCPKECSGQHIDSISSVEHLNGCTRIKGSLIIRINSKTTAEELEENLGLIKEIDGYIKIYRSSSLTSLDFLKNLKVIYGKELYSNRYAVVVYENQNLYKLWRNRVEIINGSVLFHFNSQLCHSVVDELARDANVSYSEYDVSPYSNGDKRICNYIALNVSIDLTSKSAKLAWEDYVVNSNSSFLIGYLLYYVEDPFRNITIYDDRDECNENNWNSVFVPNNTAQIDDLNAYAQYAFYIKTYTSLPSSGGQTKIRYFTTLPDDPTNPVNVDAYSTASDSITITWKPPEFPNGLISHYVLVAYYEADDPIFISRRNYCDYPHRVYPIAPTENPRDAWPKTATNGTCCETDRKIGPNTFDSICNNLDTVTELNVTSGKCKNYRYSIEDHGQSKQDNVGIVIYQKAGRKLRNKRSYPSHVENIIEKNVTDANATHFVLDSLKHFSLYFILLKACNSDGQCSGPEMVSQRTLSKEDADDVPSGPAVAVSVYDATVEWLEPRQPNAVIVAYYVEYKKTDLQNSKQIVECVTQNDFVADGRKYKLQNLLLGAYSVRVRAVSLAGPGRFGETVEFTISPPANVAFTALLVIAILLAVVTPASAFVYCRYRKKRGMDRLHLIASANYTYAASDYVVDEWEVDRDDVEILNELGKGTFGMVYSGLIKSRDCPCAIKTVNENSDCYANAYFLNEASVMKSFSNAHHVVKLLGVVSRGRPPLVLMELMSRGDLKSFLRKSRSSPGTVSCAEMYQMAAEIADGMMYLSSRKFVHRDLAARNCMVTADRTVKVGDFGMARDVYEHDYYKKETGGLMPIRWMSPESLADGVFTVDSDVWSYGIVLWEIVTLAEQPYQGLSNEQVLQFVTAQGTLLRPSACPDMLFDVMSACWQWRPNFRPLFKNIIEQLESHIGQHFRLVSFYHSSKGEEFRMNAKDRDYNPPASSPTFCSSTVVYWNASYDDLNL